jgi:hypothetical protein
MKPNTCRRIIVRALVFCREFGRAFVAVVLCGKKERDLI